MWDFVFVQWRNHFDEIKMFKEANWEENDFFFWKLNYEEKNWEINDQMVPNKNVIHGPEVGSCKLYR